MSLVAFAAPTQPAANAPTKGESVRVPDLLLGGFDDLLAQVASEMVAQGEGNDLPSQAAMAGDEWAELDDWDRDARHVFFAADVTPVPTTRAPVTDPAVCLERGVTSTGPVGDVHPEDLMLGELDGIQLDGIEFDVTDPFAALDMGPVEDAPVAPPATDRAEVAPSDDEVAQDEATGPSALAAAESIESDVSVSTSLDTDPSERMDAVQPPSPSTPSIETQSLEEVLVETVNEAAPTPELPVADAPQDTVRVEIDDDLAVEVRTVDGEVDVALLGADAVRPVLRTIEGELRDALQRGGYELGAFERDANDTHDAPRKRNPRRESRDGQPRRPRSGVLL